MGNDGGSFHHRSEIVKMKRRQKKVGHDQRMKFKNCALTGRPLEKPIVVDKVGNLINKFELIQKLIEK